MYDHDSATKLVVGIMNVEHNKKEMIIKRSDGESRLRKEWRAFSRFFRWRELDEQGKLSSCSTSDGHFD